MSVYEQALNRIRAEYLEMPGMRLTLKQVERLSGVNGAVCRLVLDDLVRARVLDISHDGKYARHSDMDRSRPPMLTATNVLEADVSAPAGTRRIEAITGA